MSAARDCALYLEKGHLFVGQGFGARGTAGGEVVFNTGMAGYQEIYTDPSYYKQVVVLTGAHVGNTGANSEDVESSKLYLSAAVVRDYNEIPSNWRSTQTLSDYLRLNEVPGISGVDTREITRIIRDEGAQRGVLFAVDGLEPAALQQRGRELIRGIENMRGLELVSRVSTDAPYESGDRFNPLVVLYDFGVKTNIVQSLTRRGLRVLVVPHDYPCEDVLKMSPVAVTLSNGPGDPAAVIEGVKQIKGIVGRLPILAICMGHQLLARALGCSTYKLKFGHHGVNHPVKDCQSGRILITSHNHGFAVREEDLGLKEIVVSHRSLNDGCVEGFISEKLGLLSVQFHPEARPGPSDASYLFDQFTRGYLR